MLVQVLTLDHEDGGRVRLDAEFAWDSPDDPVALTPDDEIVCDVSAGYVCARDACSVMWRENVRWFTIRADTLLAWQDEMLIEYDMATFAPTGARPAEYAALHRLLFVPSLCCGWTHSTRQRRQAGALGVVLQLAFQSLQEQQRVWLHCWCCMKYHSVACFVACW